VPPTDPSFWEIPVPPEILDAHEGSLFELVLEADSDTEGASERQRLRGEVVRELRRIVSTRLTRRQQQIVELYFYDGLTQQEIAATLRISQQAVSRQLFGVLRNGQRVGGAIKRLRSLCEQAGLDPDEWV
jgi:RNA polymerase sigma factor (sigma-70 family)